MLFNRTPLEGAYTIDLQKRLDERGFFARVFCAQEFDAVGLPTGFVQVSNSLSVKRGTLRGMHFQLGAAAETKVVRCVKGSMFDVIVDLRLGSRTFKQWFGTELSAENRRMMYVPRGCAHGYITLTDETEAFYFMSAFYAPELERGVRFDDPALGIKWPLAPRYMSDKDKKWPSLDDAAIP